MTWSLENGLIPLQFNDLLIMTSLLNKPLLWLLGADTMGEDEEELVMIYGTCLCRGVNICLEQAEECSCLKPS